MQDSMINAMKFWITNSDIDGFRCDVAWNVPDAFWKKCIPQLKAMKNIFMLAESDKASDQVAGFDATYPWPEFHIMNDIAAGKKNAPIRLAKKWATYMSPLQGNDLTRFEE